MEGGVAFYAGEWKVEGGNSAVVDTVGVRFRRSKYELGRKAVVFVRTKDDGRKGCETVELLQALCRIHEGRSDLPLIAYRCYKGGRCAREPKQSFACAVAEAWENE